MEGNHYSNNSREVSIQTEANPMVSHWDEKYNWNEWELRRQAIKKVLM
jgi:hypothetical protein